MAACDLSHIPLPLCEEKCCVAIPKQNSENRMPLIHVISLHIRQINKIGWPVEHRSEEWKPVKAKQSECLYMRVVLPGPLQ